MLAHNWGKMKLLLTSALLLSSFYAFAWPKHNNPHHFAKNLNLAFTDGPQKATLNKNFVAWPGNHWASNTGGISHRWSAANPMHFTYGLNSLEELRAMEQHLIDELSPAEKYDILMGRYDFPTVLKERRRTDPSDTSWFGICHGVAPAALHYGEPEIVNITNQDGINLTFYSSDLKALLSYYYAQVEKVNGKQIGRRCSRRGPEYVRNRRRASCEDMDPAAFHILITNYIGLWNKTFIVDIDPWNEVWNHVPNEYEFDIYEEYDALEHSTPGTAKVLWIGMRTSYAGAIAPFFEPVIGLKQGYYIDNHYQYELDLDANGNIIGGKWISDLRPDFIWTRPKIQRFKGYWSKLNEIYKARTQ